LRADQPRRGIDVFSTFMAYTHSTSHEPNNQGVCEGRKAMRVYSFFSLCIHLARHVCALAVLAVFAMHAAPPAHAATPATATSSAQAAPANLDDGLLSYWPFDEGSGTTSIDYGGSGNHVTFHSAAGFTNVTPALDHDNPSAFKSVDNPNSYGTAPGTNIDT
jgi:hypothetical protein